MLLTAIGCRKSGTFGTIRALHTLGVALAAVLLDGCESGSGGGGPSGAPVCGNAACESGETCASCQADCGLCSAGGNGGAVCGDGSCSGSETKGTCPGDCCQNQCSGSVCSGGSFIACVTGSDGCKTAGAPTACTGGLVCPAGGTSCQQCALQSECQALQVCTKAKSCTQALGETYNVTIETAQLPEGDPNDGGSAWDWPGGLPDIKVCVYDKSTKLGCTTVAANTLNATFNQTITGVISQQLCFIAYDDDDTGDDQADGSCYKSLDSIVKSGGYSSMMAGNVAHLSFKIAPAN